MKWLLAFLIDFILAGIVFSKTLLTSPLEPRLYKGNLQKIENFIEIRKNFINQLISQLNLIPKEELKEEERRIISEAIELLEGTSFLLSRLKREIKSKYQIPQIPIFSPPYRLKDFEKRLSFYQDSIQRLKRFQKEEKVLLDELSGIEQELNQLFLRYVEEKEKIRKYLLTAQLLSLQTEYAIRMIKKMKLEEAERKLLIFVKKQEMELEDMFKNLRFSEREKDEVLKEIRELSRKEEKLKEEVISEQKRLNRKILLFEIRLEKMKELSPKRILEVEKERIKAYLKRFQYEKEALSQKRLAISLKRLYAGFKYAWMKEKGSLKKCEGMVDEIGEKIKRLEHEFEKRRYEYSILNEKIIRIRNEIKTEEDVLVKDSLRKLYEELLLNKKYLERLLEKISENLSYARRTFWNTRYILSLVKKEKGFYENFSYTLVNCFKKLKTVVSYPIWSIGGSVITVLAIIKFFLFLCLGIFVLRLLRKKLSSFLIKRFGLSVGVGNSISKLSYYFLLILLVLIALSTAGVNLSQITIILGALGVGIGFGLQTIANNFISGLILLAERSIKVGDIIELENGLLGKVKDVSIRSTIIRTYDGLDIIVPNSELVSNKVATWTYGDDWRRLRIPFGVSYNSDPEKVVRIAKEVARKIPTTREDEEHPITVWFEGFGESSLNFSLLVWCRMEKLRPITGLISDYYFELFRRFKEEGIEIPFPQRDIHIRSFPESIKKGDEKNEV